MGRPITTTDASVIGEYKETQKQMGLLMTAIEFPLLRTAVGMVKAGVVECFLGRRGLQPLSAVLCLTLQPLPY
jgi:hypothetical protein